MSRITESARGEECQIRIPGVCNGNPETVVWCHANGSAAGKGVWMKSIDLLGAYGCNACHDAYDRRSFRYEQWHTREQVENWFWEGHARSIRLLLEKGIIHIERGTVSVST